MRVFSIPAALAATLAVASFVSASGAQANKETVLHIFSGGADGGYPQSAPIIGSDGNLYGSTYQGGNGFGYGVIYKFTPSGAETVLYSFQDEEDGYGPYGGLTRDKAGNLYGATIYGYDGYGTVFRLAPDGTETELYTFSGSADGDGERPESRLLRDSRGNLYGTTTNGGNKGCGSSCGTIFRLAPDGTETVLHAFSGGSEGGFPTAGLIQDSSGNLYGTTNGDSCFDGCGTVFRLSPKGKMTVLHQFTGGSDGGAPDGGLIFDPAGNLYGTASAGGGGNCSHGCGVVFKLAPDGTETVLHGLTGGKDGATPTRNLLLDAAGNLYGVANAGGNSACLGGCGAVFKLASDGTYSVLHAFSGGANDGANPVGIVIDKRGNLYGATFGGGTGCGGSGCGTLFKIRN